MRKRHLFWRQLAAAGAALILLACPLALSADALDAETLIPIGRTVGIKMYVDGVFLTRLSAVQTASGSVSPAETAGLRPGDVITAVGGTAVTTTSGLQSALEKNGTKKVSLNIDRNGTAHTVSLTPCRDTDGVIRIGAFVRDSCAGIGTITFYDPQSGVLGALGHGIADRDSGVLIPIGSGSLLGLTVTGVTKGVKGTPGELAGSFDLHNEAGSLTGNLETGLYGKIEADDLYPALFQAAPIPVGGADTVKTGKAEILANVSGDTVERYEIEILRVFDAHRSTRNMMIRVTDERLLAKTGGIVQGMSGSPILQNGKIVGAVTHVLVGDPQCGYGIFIENMLRNADTVSLDLAA